MVRVDRYTVGLSRFHHLYDGPASPAASNIALTRAEHEAISGVSGLRGLTDHHEELGRVVHDGFGQVRAVEFRLPVRSYFDDGRFVASSHPLHRLSIGHFWDRVTEGLLARGVASVDFVREEHLLTSDQRPPLIRREAVREVPICFQGDEND